MPEPSPAAPPNPLRSCDVVMKGGITSGVVYPLAVAELARDFRFRSIGGTSAGAIAAAATAAAEHGRQTGGGSGFAGLVDLPRRMTEVLDDGRSRLFSLFQPVAETAPLFGIAMAALRVKGVLRKGLAIAGEMILAFPEGAWLGALPGLLPAVALGVTLAGPAGSTLVSTLAKLGLGLAFVSSLALAGAGALLGGITVLAWRAVAVLPAHGFGLCRGCAGPGEASAGPPPLTLWLADLLDELAGKDRGTRPLTFGNLAAAGIHLEMMTTCLSLGRPYRLPFERVFLFKPSELALYFPARVVAWMVAHPHPEGKLGTLYHDGERLYSLPDGPDLPVVFAARLSLSFPILISAVPLYGVDFDAAEPTPERCWFSDGGLTSNLPIHFFDSPLPAWPTVAVDLVAGTPDPADPEASVWLPETNGAGLLEGWRRLDEGSSGARLLSFFGSLLNVMQNWRDQTLSRLPGQRDRIAHVILGEEEGGLNLEMSPELIAALTERGRAAGRKLRHRFAEPPGPGELSWDNHRWVRFREAMSAIEDLLVAWAEAYDRPAEAGELTYEELLQRDARTPPGSYRLANQKQRDRMARLTARLAELGRELSALAGTAESFHRGEPHPPGELRVRPRI